MLPDNCTERLLISSGTILSSISYLPEGVVVGKVRLILVFDGVFDFIWSINECNCSSVGEFVLVVVFEL